MKPLLSNTGPLQRASSLSHHQNQTFHRAQPFSGHYNENPCQHMHEFEEMCSCLSISDMTQETLKWKLFSFSLTRKAKQWYTHIVESTNGDWDELKDKFYLAFFPISHIISLPRVILDFEQREKDSIGVA